VGPAKRLSLTVKCIHLIVIAPPINSTHEVCVGFFIVKAGLNWFSSACSFPEQRRTGAHKIRRNKILFLINSFQIHTSDRWILVMLLWKYYNYHC
jgi:hypothetical protein